MKSKPAAICLLLGVVLTQSAWADPPEVSGVVTRGEGGVSGFGLVIPDTASGLTAVLGSTAEQFVSECMGVFGPRDTVSFQSLQVTDEGFFLFDRFLDRQFGDVNVSVWSWDGTGDLCEAILAQPFPVAEGQVQLVANNSDFFHFIACVFGTRQNALTWGTRAHGLVIDSSGEERILNAHFLAARANCGETNFVIRVDLR